MRLNNLIKVLGLTAAVAMPVVLTGCDDDPSNPSADAATDSAVGDTLIKTDSAPKTDTNTSETGTTPDTGTTGDTGTAGDTAGDATTNG